MDSDLIDQLLAISHEVRYVAVARGQQVLSKSRPGIASASSTESDFYEEILVNPVLLALARQRGDIDCGGMRFVVVGYGSFQQVVVPIPGGHLSIALESSATPTDFVPKVSEIMARHRLE